MQSESRAIPTYSSNQLILNTFSAAALSGCDARSAPILPPVGIFCRSFTAR